MTETGSEKFLPDLSRTLACGILTFVGAGAIVLGSVFLLNGAFHGAARPDLIFFGAIASSGVVLCAGSIFLTGGKRES